MGVENQIESIGIAVQSNGFALNLKKLQSVEDLNEVEWILDQLSHVFGFENGFLLERNRLGTMPVKASAVFDNKSASSQKRQMGTGAFDFQTLSNFVGVGGAKSQPYILLNESSEGDLTEVNIQYSDDIAQCRFDVILIPMLPIWSIDYVVGMHGKNVDISYVMLGKIHVVARELKKALARCLKKDFDALADLSKREQEVLAWTSQGKTSFEIAGILELSEHTINNYMANLINKLGATNRNHAVAIAIHLGLI